MIAGQPSDAAEAAYAVHAGVDETAEATVRRRRRRSAELADRGELMPDAPGLELIAQEINDAHEGAFSAPTTSTARRA